MSRPAPYGYLHQLMRAKLLPRAYGTPCPMCGLVMLRGQRLHLDHTIPLALGGTRGDRIVHGWCNEAAGARLRNRRQRGLPPQGPVGSQDW